MGQHGTFPALDSGRPADPPHLWTWHSGICILTKIALKPPISAHSTSVLAQEHTQASNVLGCPSVHWGHRVGSPHMGSYRGDICCSLEGASLRSRCRRSWPLLGLQSPPSCQSLRGLPSAHKRYCFPCASQSPLRTPVRLDWGPSR